MTDCNEIATLPTVARNDALMLEFRLSAFWRVIDNAVKQSVGFQLKSKKTDKDFILSLAALFKLAIFEIKFNHAKYSFGFNLNFLI